MVYRGKPSLGCELCRRRKIRCDQARPACGQCVKHGAVCPGYRDLGASNFLDESQAVIRKAQARSEPSSSALRSQSASTTPQPAAFLARERDSASPQRLGPFASSPPATPIEDKALAYFYNRFITPGWILFLPDQQSVRNVDPTLRNSLLCTALASFANKIGSKDDLIQARRRYARALTLTNDALRDMETAKKDQTLVAVLLLGLFENLDCDNLERMTSWQKHVRGCSALLRLRSPSKLLTPAGFEMFAQLRPLVLVNSMWDHTPVAPHWADYLRFSDKYHSARQRRVNQLVWICIDIAEVRSRIRDGKITDPLEIYHRIKKLDMRLADWEEAAALNPQWMFETIHDPLAEPSAVWQGTYHTYQDYGTSLNWGMLRSMRILLANMMSFRLLQTGIDPELKEQIKIGETRSRMFADIMAATPWKLGMSQSSSPGYPSHAPVRDNRDSMAFPMFPAYSEQLILFFLGESITLITEEGRDLCDFLSWANTQNEPSATSDTVSIGRQERFNQLQWVIGRLDYIGKLGIRQGAIYADILRKKWDPQILRTNPKDRMQLWKQCRNIHERMSAIQQSNKMNVKKDRFFSPEMP